MVTSYPIRVGYDAQAFLSPNLGLGKGVQLRSLVEPYSDRFVGFATRGRNYSNQVLVQRGVSTYHLWQQTVLPHLIRKWKVDFFLAPYNTAPLILPKRTRLILVLHDLILLERFHLPTVRERLRNEFRRFLVPKAVRRAHTVLTVSHYSKQQILSRFPSAHVAVIPCSIAPSWFVKPNDVAKFEERDNYILVVTGSVAHKNARRALEAYAKFVSQADRSTVPHLRVVGVSGSASEFRRLAGAIGIADLVHIEPYLTELQLQGRYRRARVVLFPSLMEGFGIPVLEAMASGTPVITSDTTSMPEVGGSAAQYFDPTSVNSMAATLKHVLDNRDQQERMIELGLARANHFHSRVIGRQIEEFWDALLPSTSPVETNTAANAGSH